ncbi:apolipoprotein N-acyltransferase [Vibrio sp. 10N.261.55.A7]|uniref:apolipoprotein N-acyltransferase n=1 Tax=Vibrio sp. 10N.261.55.A7 TaxID=1880851 RepID=UPI000C83FE88|nr:apolipoprotein N-acyltransferase [Vibrio sp. 10N.261.55.A7]PMJ90458.1 apolipoprotein N-acyltransferase [Vibrio sp. 10N.261.55.A7]
MTNNIAHRLIRPLGAVFIGALTTLSFAPFSIWPIAIISPLVLFLLLQGQSAKQGFFIGYAWGIGLFATGISWVHISIDVFGGMPKIAGIFLMALLVGYLALYSGLFAWSLNRFFPTLSRHRFFLAAPALWLITDWLRGWIMTGFPWLWLGYSQIDAPLANFAPIGGVELITLAILLCSSSLAFAILKRSWSILIIPIVILISGFSLRNIDWVIPNYDETTKVALIQGNVDQSSKWLPNQRWPTIMKYVEFSKENWDADVIIWPEAAIPAFEFEIPSFLRNLDESAKMNQTSIITGVVNKGDNNDFYNSVLAIGATPYGEYNYDPNERYHKHHLLPFGEFVPFEDILRPIAPFFNLPMSSFSRGDFVQPNIIANGRHMAPALCYEIIFNEQVRMNVTDDTDFILTLSNDAWFGDSIGPLQHMEIARMRAKELGKPLIRSTNNGVTAVTDFKGNIIKQVPQFETAVLNATLHSTEGHTPYRYVGTWPLYIWSLMSLILATIVSNKRRSNQEV